MHPRRLGFAAASLFLALAGIGCADELPPPENAGGSAGASASGGASGSGGSGGSGALDAGGTGGDAGCVCAPDHATGSCDTGSCVVVSCQSGFGNCDNKDDNGCEEHLHVDGNCGACGRSCLGATCTAGMCEATTLISGLTSPWGVLVDDSWIYVSDFDDGIIDRASKIDGSGRKSLASGYSSTWFMVRDGAYVYFTTREGNTVERVLADGSAPAETFLSPGVKTSALAVDASNIYFTESKTNAYVWRAPKQKNGTAVKLVTVQPLPYGLAVDGTNAYWGSGTTIGSGEVRRVAKTATPDSLAGQLIATGQGAIRNLILDSNMVFWTSQDSGFGRVTRYDIAAAKLDVLAVTELAEYAAVDEKHIYWTAREGSSGYIYRLERDYQPGAQAAPVVKLFSEVGSEPLNIAVDGTWLYFTDEAQGRVVKIPK